MNTTRADTERLRADHNTTVTRLELENASLQSALNARERMVVAANQTISDLERTLNTAQEDAGALRVRNLRGFSVICKSNATSTLDTQDQAVIDANQKASNLLTALNTAREDVERLQADHNTTVARFQRDNANLQAALDARERAVVDANQTILNLESTLNTAREKAERHGADHNAIVIRLERTNSDLRFALEAQELAVIEANQTISNLESASTAARENAERLRV